ncbi:MAG: hypothetical protein CSA04_03590 [Bacteroidetes bacterium]|nr:MAG: hypothetical protein CSA04_03590 [Bacteroidota bacterium]
MAFRSTFIERPSPWKALLIYLLSILIVGLLLNFLGALLAGVLYGLPLADILQGKVLDPTVENAPFLKFYQIVNHLGMFLFPSLLFMHFFMNREDFMAMGLGRKVSVLYLLVGAGLLFLALPFTNMLLVWNEALVLPPFLRGLEEKLQVMEESAARLTELFFLDASIKGLMVNLLMIALIPAVGEELVFRGVLFRLFRRIVKNSHLTVWITSLLFSAMHLQFYGFLPRLFLGLLFGYLLLYTRNFWVPVFAHFVNNGTAVVVAWLSGGNGGSLDVDSFGRSDSWGIVLLSGLSVGGTLYLLYHFSKQKKEAKHQG